jgi:antitoxin YefM
MRTINFSDARQNLKEVLDRVVDDADITIITRRDPDDVVLMSLSAYNRRRETMHLMSSPANARRLNESIAQARAGRALPRQRDGVETSETLMVHEPEVSFGPKRKAANRSKACAPKRSR